jgi:hypothetical protein
LRIFSNHRLRTKAKSSHFGDLRPAGDRWNDAPDGLFGHDPQTWAPMTFDAKGSILPLAFHNNFSIELAL